MNRKEAVRKKFRAVRDRLPESYRQAASGRIAERLMRTPEFKRSKMVAIYLSKGSEVDTFPLLKKVYSLRKTAAAPRVNERMTGLDFFQIKRGLKDCRLGFYSIWEPNERCPGVNPRKIDLVIVPGVAFDRKGHRLGYGKGYYDRFLKGIPGTPAVGLTYEKTFTRSLPHDRGDVPVSCVITETKICRPGRPGQRGK